MRLLQALLGSLAIAAIATAGCSSTETRTLPTADTGTIQPSISPAAEPVLADESGAIAQEPEETLALEQVSVGGVGLGAPEAVVLQALGTPNRQFDEDWSCCGTVRTLEYGADTKVQMLDIAEGKFEVFSFSTRDPNLSTPDGIRIGDSRQLVESAYGPSVSINEENGETTLYYSAPIDYAAALWFKLEGDSRSDPAGNRVVEIGYDAQLN
jgi:hypothetical protein